MKRNLCALLTAEETISVEDRPIPKPGPGQVLVSVQAVGICGSDVHMYRHRRIGAAVAKGTHIMGHEGSGVIVEMGCDVTSLKIGDRVALEPGVPCRTCKFCSTGRYNLCADVKFLSCPPVHGLLCQYQIHAAENCFKLPDHVSLEEGALLEPLSVGVQACRRAGVTLGSRLFISGCGPIGLINLMIGKTMGASFVVMTDINEHRLELAKQFGCDRTVLITKDKTLEEQKNEIVDAFGGFAPDISIECCGLPASVQLCVLTTGWGGVVTLIGLGGKEMMFPVLDIVWRELDIRGVHRYANCYPTALAMLAQGQIDVKKLITHHYQLEDIEAAIATAAKQADGTIKVMISCGNPA